MSSGGVAKRPEYKAWLFMRAKCYDTKSKSYPLFGGRGVHVFQNWVDSFLEFLGDMERYPGKGYGVGLIDPNKNFEPGNAHWVKQGSHKKEAAGKVPYQGRLWTIRELAEEYGINPAVLRTRLHKNWSIDLAVLKPVQIRRARRSKG